MGGGRAGREEGKLVLMSMGHHTRTCSDAQCSGAAQELRQARRGAVLDHGTGIGDIRETVPMARKKTSCKKDPRVTALVL